MSDQFPPAPADDRYRRPAEGEHDASAAPAADFGQSSADRDGANQPADQSAAYGASSSPAYGQQDSSQSSYGQGSAPAYGQSASYGQQGASSQASYGQPSYGQGSAPAYGQQSQPAYGQQDQYGQTQAGQQPYGQSAPAYGQAQAAQGQAGQGQPGQGQYGQPQYGQSQSGTTQYGQSQYGQSQGGQQPYGQSYGQNTTGYDQSNQFGQQSYAGTATQAGAPGQRKLKGITIAGMIALGLGLISTFFMFFGGLASIAAAVLGFIAMKKNPEARPWPLIIAIAGAVLALINIIGFIWFAVQWATFLTQYPDYFSQI